jgi:hypothetical protein
MSSILPGRSEIFAWSGEKNLSAHSLLFPSIFSPKTIIYQAHKSDIVLCEHKHWVIILPVGRVYIKCGRSGFERDGL